MGDFAFYPDVNKRLNYVFNIHEIIEKTIPEEFDKYLEIVRFTLGFLKKIPKKSFFLLMILIQFTKRLIT